MLRLVNNSLINALRIEFLVIVLMWMKAVDLVQGGANNLHMMDGISTSEVVGSDIFFEIIEPIELEYTYRLRPAKDFGAPFNGSFKLKEIPLVVANPEEACSDITNWEDIRGSVALVERGDCSFLTKAIYAEKAGARAVIVTESSASVGEDEDYYIEMVHDYSERDTNIPVGYLLGKNGRIIRKTLKKLNQDYAIINIPVNLTFIPPHLINHPPWLGW